MLRKMKKAAAWVLTSALLLSVGTPASAYAAAPVYTASEADLKDGKLEIKGGSYAKIIIPEDLQAEEISLNGVTAAEFVVEGGIDAEINISGGSIAKVQVEEVKEEMPTLRDKAKLMRDGKSKSDADKEYKGKKQEVKKKKEKTPEIVLKDSAAVKTIDVSGNAKLDLGGGKADTIVISAKSSDMKVTVDGFKGKLFVEEKAENKADTAYGTVELELNNSVIEKAEIVGDGNASIVVSGTDSIITEAMVGGETSLVLGVETKKLETTEDSRDVALVILAVVIEVVINGIETSMDLTADAIVTIATINGDNVMVEGTGKVETVVTENETVKVETEDTTIKTPAEVTPTTIPTVAPVVVPTTAPSTGGGSGSGSWYPTETPVPTKAPTETPDEPEETPVPTETPDEPIECEHEWDEGEVTTEATCTKDGEKTYTCALCKETKTEVIEVAGHTLETTKTTTTASCAAITVEVTKCSVCDEYEPTENTTWEETGIAHTWEASIDGTVWSCTVCEMTTTENPFAGAGDEPSVTPTPGEGEEPEETPTPTPDEEEPTETPTPTPDEKETCENCTWVADWSTLTCSVCGTTVTSSNRSSATATMGALSVNYEGVIGEYTVILGNDINEVITTTASNLGMSATSSALKITVQSYNYGDETAPYSKVIFVEAHLIDDGNETNLQGCPSYTIYVPAAEANTTLGCWATGGGTIGTTSALFDTDKLIINGQMFMFYGIPK